MDSSITRLNTPSNSPISTPEPGSYFFIYKNKRSIFIGVGCCTFSLFGYTIYRAYIAMQS
jgi:hypothetical protein